MPSTEVVNWKDPALSTRAVREYLQALDSDAVRQVLPKNISLTDPQANCTAAPGGPAFYAYSTNYLIDTGHGVIVDVQATPAHRTTEVESAKTMIDRVEELFNLKPARLIGDTAYGTAAMLGWMVDDKGIESHVPVWDRTQRDDGTLSSSDFEWNEQADEYRCPEGHALRKQWRPFKNERTHITQADTIIYRACQHHCAICLMKQRCFPNTPARKIARSIHESGARQGSCRLIHAASGCVFAGFERAATTESRSGLRVTGPMGVQSRVFPDHRAGLRARA
jgi:hypothetical protein